MRRTGHGKRVAVRLAGGPGSRSVLSDELKVRASAIALWLLVATAALGGLVALLRPLPHPTGEQVRGTPPSVTVAEAEAAAGYAVLFVSAYIEDGTDPPTADSAAGILANDTPPESAPVADASTVSVVAIEPVDEGYWAVTVAAPGPAGMGFWRVGVASRGGGLAAMGPPTPVTAPPVADRPDLAVSWETPPPDDPALGTVLGWIAAYACGQGDVSRWLAPGLRLAPIVPPLCGEVRLDRWGSRPEGDERLVVVTEAVLDPGVSERRVTFSLLLVRRDGRWEVAEVLPAPPLADQEEGP